MNKVGIFIGYWSRTWEGDYKYYIDKAATLGFDILEVTCPPFLTMSDYQMEELKRAAQDKGIEITFCVGFSKDQDIASEDAAIRKKGIAFARRNLEAMNKMGGSVFAGIDYSAWHGTLPPEILDKRPYVERSLDSMREIIKTAEDYGIIYCVEVVNRFEQYLLNTAQEAVEYVDEINSPNLKILLDTFHMNIEEDSMAGAIRLAANRIGHFHVGECNRKLPGTGNNIAWDEIFKSLKEVNYQHRIVMEPFVKMGGEVGNAIGVWRDLSNNASEEMMDTEAKRALEFIRTANKIRFVSGG